MPSELEEVSNAGAPNWAVRILTRFVQLVEFLHHGNTQIRQTGQSNPSSTPPRDAAYTMQRPSILSDTRNQTQPSGNATS